MSRSKYRWKVQGAMVIHACAGIPQSALYIGKSKEHQSIKKKKSIFFLLLFYRWCHPVGPLVKTTVALSLSAVLYCCATTFSPLGSILSPAQQRQVANFLPFNLQQFPCSRRSQTQEEEPRLPWVNWGRGLAKRQWREVKVF